MRIVSRAVWQEEGACLALVTEGWRGDVLVTTCTDLLRLGDRNVLGFYWHEDGTISSHHRDMAPPGWRITDRYLCSVPFGRVRDGVRIVVTTTDGRVLADGDEVPADGRIKTEMHRDRYFGSSGGPMGLEFRRAGAVSDQPSAVSPSES